VAPARAARWIATLAAFGACVGAFAAHPLQTEDTGTQGAGRVEWENGFAWTRDSAGRALIYQPQLSFGAASALDLIVQPSWLAVRADDGGETRGFGDTNLDAKWRFFGATPWSLAVRAGANLATSQHALGLRHGTADVHGVLVATLDVAPLRASANVGILRQPSQPEQRTVLRHASLALSWVAAKGVTLAVEGVAATDPDPARGGWPATGLLGVICTLVPGLDLDAGYRSGIGSRSSARQALLGVTYRFAP